MASLLRAEGNQFYKAATDEANERKHYLWKVGNLSSATRCFEKGIAIAAGAGDIKEWVSCTRSVAVAAHRIASLEGQQAKGSQAETMFHFVKALQYFCAALAKGESVNNREWTRATQCMLVQTYLALGGFLTTHVDDGRPLHDAGATAC